MSEKLSRRDFIKTTAIGALAAGLVPVARAQGEAVPKREFGKTGLKLSIIGLGGGSNYLKANDEEAQKILQRAVELGVNYFDTAAQYGNRASEKRYGQYLSTVRDKVHIGSKTQDRTYDGAMKSVEESLKNLKTDHLDI